MHLLPNARRLAAWLSVAALAGGLSACEDYYGTYYGPPAAYADVDYYAYYDGFYGPFYGGYWGPRGRFYYWDAGRHYYHRDAGAHFRHDVRPGFNGVHGHAPPPVGHGPRPGAGAGRPGPGRPPR